MQDSVRNGFFGACGGGGQFCGGVGGAAEWNAEAAHAISPRQVAGLLPVEVDWIRGGWDGSSWRRETDCGGWGRR